jgi:hypothetical protein
MRNPAYGAAAAHGPAASAHDLADMARSGYELLHKPLMQVQFEVHHTVDKPGYLRDNVVLGHELEPPAQESLRTKSVFMEALVSAANGVGVVIGTSADRKLMDAQHRQLGVGTVAEIISDAPDRRIFKGTARPNPTFLFESAATYEGIVSVDPAPRKMRFGQSVAVRDLITEISRIAVEVAEAPLLFLQAPAHLPPHSFVGEDIRSRVIEVARHASSLAVRFSIALQQPSAQLRTRLTDTLRQYCVPRGFGLWLADSRIGYRTGNWFQICVHNAKGAARSGPDHAGAVDANTVDACIPVTLVGPARIGSTFETMSFLSQYNDVGIMSSAMTTLDDVALIHLQVCVRGARRSQQDELNARLTAYGSLPAKPQQALEQLHDILVPSQRGSAQYVRSEESSERTGDYQSLIGPILPCVVSDRRKRIAIWFSWQMEGVGRDLATPISHLFQAFRHVGLILGEDDGASPGALPNVEYLICRDIGNSVLRAKGKLAISESDVLALFAGDGIEAAAVNLCMSLEDAWRASIVDNGVEGVNELAVAWREWWLRHWASPL